MIELIWLAITLVLLAGSRWLTRPPSIEEGGGASSFEWYFLTIPNTTRDLIRGNNFAWKIETYDRLTGTATSSDDRI